MAAARLFGLVGSPVQHSASPKIFKKWFEQYGLDAEYVAFNVPSKNGAAILRSLRTLSVAGVNVTAPLKAVMARAVDRCLGDAICIGAVNVVVAKGQQWEGHNTDAEGFVRSLDHQFGSFLLGKSVAVLGAGGAAAAVVAGVARRGVRSVTLLNRTPRRALALHRRMAGFFPEVTFASGRLGAASFREVAPSVDLVVICTSGAAASEIASLDFDVLPRSSVVSDLNYWMVDRPWLDRMRARGAGVDDGYGMLLHQAAVALEHFTGVTVPVDDLRRDLR